LDADLHDGVPLDDYTGEPTMTEKSVKEWIENEINLSVLRQEELSFEMRELLIRKDAEIAKLNEIKGNLEAGTEILKDANRDLLSQMVQFNYDI
jgi:hypothetical protein